MFLIKQPILMFFYKTPILMGFFTKQPILMRRLAVLSLPFRQAFPCLTNKPTLSLENIVTSIKKTLPQTNALAYRRREK
jgi:hypothetical protein